jgi:uncharacterized protein YbjT (DUF2867 family)
MRLLVVGATGSLGRLTVAEAARRGHEVAALVRDPTRANLPEPVARVRGDVLDAASPDPALAGKDAVVCALGTPSPRQASSLLEDQRDRGALSGEPLGDVLPDAAASAGHDRDAAIHRSQVHSRQ